MLAVFEDRFGLRYYIYLNCNFHSLRGTVIKISNLMPEILGHISSFEAEFVFHNVVKKKKWKKNRST